MIEPLTSSRKMASRHLVHLILATVCMVVRAEVTVSDLETRINDLSSKITSLQQEIKPLDCAAIYKKGQRVSGVQYIYPNGDTGIQVHCDMETEGGGWTVIHERFVGRVDFFRGWEEYAKGFGKAKGEFWIGLQHMHELTHAQPTELYVGLTDYDLGFKCARYGVFKVADETNKFRLTIGSYTGDAGDSMSYHNGALFSTKDQDNDGSDTTDCSNALHGCWWYKDDLCLHSDLNGRFIPTKITSTCDSYMLWYYLQNSWTSLKAAFMMIRPANFQQTPSDL